VAVQHDIAKDLFFFFLVDLSGGLCTWSNSQSWSRIDHFLVSVEWEVRHPDLLQKRLLCLCSDHFPIVLVSGDCKGGRKPFKFENMW
jgi:endonuclease/exonuclease/phosphatase family metal-dependent hydrolase